MPKPRCSACRLKRMSGVLDQPLRTATEERVIERCDVCERYATDAEAAVHWVTRFGGRLRYDKRAIIWTPEVDTTEAATVHGGKLTVVTTKHSMLQPKQEVA